MRGADRSPQGFAPFVPAPTAPGHFPRFRGGRTNHEIARFMNPFTPTIVKIVPASTNAARHTHGAI